MLQAHILRARAGDGEDDWAHDPRKMCWAGGMSLPCTSRRRRRSSISFDPFSVFDVGLAEGEGARKVDFQVCEVNLWKL